MGRGLFEKRLCKINRHFRKDRITHLPMKEYVTRLTSNFTMLAMGLAMIHRVKDVDDSHYEIVKHIAKGTPPQNYEKLVSALIRAGKSVQFTATDMSDMVGLPVDTARMIAEDLSMLKVLRKIKTKIDSHGEKSRWKFTSHYLDLTVLCITFLLCVNWFYKEIYFLRNQCEFMYNWINERNTRGTIDGKKIVRWGDTPDAKKDLQEWNKKQK